MFGGPAGTATFNLADWGEVSGTPDQKGNELFGFAPILSKEDESTFTLTGAAGDGPNFTQATITGGTLLLDAATLTMASGADPLLNDTGGILHVRGNSSILGHLTNHGTITLQDGVAGDILTVSGNYRAGSRLLVDVDLSANTADRLVVTGDATGRTDLEVVAQGSGQSTDTNANGQWDTGEGILVVEVQGQSPADAFVLVDTVTANGFTYNLYYDSATGNWYLSSLDFVTLPDGRVVDALLVSPKSPLYRSLYVNMRGLTRVAGLFDRIRGRLWRTGGVESGAGANFVVADNLALSAGNGLWIDLDASRADLEPKTRYAGTAFTVDRDTAKLEIGYDHLLWRGAHGGLVGGISAHYGEVNADIKSVLGKGSIDTEGYGFGLTGTWYTAKGTYIDAQARYTRFSHRVDSDTKGELKDNLGGSGTVFSLEVGQRLGLSPTWTLTPQIQLWYSDLVIERRQPDTGSGGGYDLYGKLNAYHTFDREKRLDFATTALGYEDSKWVGEAAIGGVYRWGQGGKYAVYGEVGYTTDLENADHFETPHLNFPVIRANSTLSLATEG